MAIKDILVHLDSSPELDDRLRTAVDLANRYEAHLTGLFVVPSYPVPGYVDIPLAPGIAEDILKSLWEKAETTRTKAQEIVKKCGGQMEWRAEEGEPVSIINSHGRCADLVIVGQSNPKVAAEISSDTIEKMILSIGRPVMMTPYARSSKTTGHRILIAWKPGCEATRAINDAMPLLTQAKSVEVMSVNPDKNNADEGEVPGVDITTHLARHGVNAEVKTVQNASISVANVMLSHAADEDIDLIVMGAYGHSRFREIVLGGVTRDILKQMTVPILFSH